MRQETMPNNGLQRSNLSSRHDGGTGGRGSPAKDVSPHSGLEHESIAAMCVLEMDCGQSYLEENETMTRQHKKKKNPLLKGMPEGAIVADPSKQIPNGSYDPPPLWYIDKDFVCVNCGTEETWTAEQQKWYYEEANGTLYARAKRCYDCRKKIRDAKALQREQMAASKKASDSSTKHT